MWRMPELVPLAARPGSGSASSRATETPRRASASAVAAADHAGADDRHFSVALVQSGCLPNSAIDSVPSRRNIGRPESRTARPFWSGSPRTAGRGVQSGTPSPAGPPDPAGPETRRPGRAAARRARLQAGALARLERLHQLRDLVHDHLGPRRDLHDLRPGLERTAARSRSRSAGR